MARTEDGDDHGCGGHESGHGHGHGHGHGQGGDVGRCVCPRCETTIPHRPGVPCRTETCPKCGATRLFREGSEHHRQWLENRRRRQGAADGSE